MTLRWIEGFEATRANEVLARIYTATLATGTLGQNEGFSLATGVAVSGAQALTTPALVGAPTNTWISGFAVRGNATSPGTGVGVAFANSDGEQFKIELEAVSVGASKAGGTYYRLAAKRGATTLATSNEVFWIGNDQISWVHFEVKVVIDNSTGSFAVKYWRRKDQVGIQDITWSASNTNVDTQNQSSAGADRCTLHMTTSVYVDDWHVCDNAGSKNNDFIGPQMIVGLVVDGVGDTSEWDLQGGAANIVQAWAKAATSTDVDLRMNSQTSGDIQLATLSALTGIREVSVTGVRQTHYGRMETSLTLAIDMLWRKTTGTPATFNGLTYTLDSTLSEGFVEVLENDPNTATDWIVADIDGLQIGAERA